jgi:hypothetical protein
MPVRREGEGASVGDPGWELVAAGRGSAHPLRREGASSVAPRLASLSLALGRESEAGGGRRWQTAASCHLETPDLTVQDSPNRTPAHRGKH